VAEDGSQKAGGWPSKLYKGLSAPLLITVVGAILAGYLIPRIASQVDDDRKAREIQTSLVQDMSEAVAPVIATGRLLATGTVRKAGKNPTAVFNDTLVEWETSRASISARLRSYFGESVRLAWDKYSDAVHNLYYLSTTQLTERCRKANELKTYLIPNDPTVSCPEFGNEAKEGPACKREEKRTTIAGGSWPSVTRTH
jgi:hypothetical protein